MKKVLLLIIIFFVNKISLGMKKEEKFKPLTTSFSSDEENLFTNQEIIDIFQIIHETNEEHTQYLTERANNIVSKEPKYSNYVFGNALKEGKKNLKLATIVYLIKSELKRIEEKQQKDMDEIKLLLKNLQVSVLVQYI